MTRDEIVDFLEWAKEEGQLQFPESRKVDMAERYLEAQNQALRMAGVVVSPCDHSDTYPLNQKYSKCRKCGGCVED
jgi:hypothetical protein